MSDEAILNAIPAMARLSGVFGEPAGATAYAGLIKAVRDGLVSATDRVVVLNTGNGLKDIASAMTAVDQIGTVAHRVSPDLEDVKRVVQTLK